MQPKNPTIETTLSFISQVSGSDDKRSQSVVPPTSVRGNFVSLHMQGLCDA